MDKEVSDELEGEKLEGDAALNKLFKDIYDRADEVGTAQHSTSPPLPRAAHGRA